ncbi:MAG: chloride channel protein [Carnobacterium sp.]|nr:chloride channel protein [Carnobacterium sp.]
MGNAKDYYSKLLIFSISAGAIGLVVGAITALFGRVLIAITNYREMHAFYLLPFLAFVGLIIVSSYQKYGKNTAKGMGLVFAVGNNEEEVIPKRMIPLVIMGTWLTHLFGGSAGREGVAVQIGAVVGHSVSRKLPYKEAGKILLVAGMAAGFGGLFQTPLAGIFFAMEVLMVGKIESRALIPTAIAAFAASTTSHLLGIEKFTATIESPGAFAFSSAWKVILLGLSFGIVGGIFAFGLKKAKQLAAFRFPDPYKRIFFIGIAVSLLFLLLYSGRYSGLGTNLIGKSFETGTIYSYDWILKLMLTIVTLAAGFQGGEVTPLFAIGATLGIALAPIVGLPLTFAAALGYIAVFAAATNTFMGPLFIGAEVFGYQYLPFFFIVVITAYVFNGNQTIYGGQKEIDWV